MIFNNLRPKIHRSKTFVSGFTLIEMLVVIAVIGILYGIVMASVSDSKKRSRDSKRIADISVIQLALEKYYDQHKSYPANLNVFSNSNSSDYDSSLLIKDPLGSSYGYTTKDINGGNCSTNNCQSYLLNIELELDNNILKDDANPNNGKIYDAVPKF